MMKLKNGFNYSKMVYGVNNKAEHTPMYKNNSRNSSKFKGCSPLQFHRELEDLSSAVGYYFYA